MTIRITWKRVIVTLIGLFALGMAFAWSGVMNLAASSGHWAITDWFLHWTMRNSVRTHAALTVPDDPKARDGVVSAAGLFKASCAACHGAPRLGGPRLVDGRAGDPSRCFRCDGRGSCCCRRRPFRRVDGATCVSKRVRASVRASVCEDV